MEEFEKINRALRLVERYEQYLFRRACGVALIICGAVFPSTALLGLKAQAMAELLNMSPEAFVAFVPGMILLIGVGTIIYIFTSAHVATSRMRKSPVWKDAPHMILMFMIWFTSFFLTNYVPEPFTVVSWLWAGGLASLLSYFVLKREPAHENYPQFLIIGIICLAASLPILILRNRPLVETITFLVFGVSFVSGGLYSIANASKVLSESEK